MLTRKRLKEVLCYKRHTGFFTWKESRGRAKKGKIAGSGLPGEYVRIWIDRVCYKAHRLVFLYVDGYLPENGIDHIKGIKDDNRRSQIREASQRCNAQNMKLRRESKTGYTGVSFSKANSRWRSTICVNGKDIHIGYYDEKVDAAVARVEYEDYCPDWHCNSQDCNRKKLRDLGVLV